MTNHSLDFPGTIAAYFTMEKSDATAVTQLFAENAVVRDEGKTYNGLEAIIQWKTNVSSKYQYTSVPFASEVDGEKIVVTSRLTGNFPGSPIDLRFFFRIENNKIASLEIVL